MSDVQLVPNTEMEEEINAYQMVRSGLIDRRKAHWMANSGFLSRNQRVQMCRNGVLPQANFKLYDRQTKTVEQRIFRLGLEEYIGTRLLSPTQVSFFEPAREWHKEKAMNGATLSMDMEGRQKEAIEFEKFVTHLPGWTKNWGYSWRTLGISQRTGRPLDSLTERQAIARMLISANSLILNGDEGEGIKGLIAEVPAGNVRTAAAVWDHATDHDPYEDIRAAIELTADENLPVSRWNVAMHPNQVSQAQRLRSTSVDTTFWDLIRRNFGNRLNIVESTAIPDGTILGVPASDRYADLLTTGLPVVVPIRADNMGVEFQARMIAVPRVAENKTMWKITGA